MCIGEVNIFPFSLVGEEKERGMFQSMTCFLRRHLFRSFLFVIGRNLKHINSN
jgi:hypothetical protein